MNNYRNSPRLSSGTLGANKIAKIITGIALAMRFIHSCNVIHGDLKPDNILLDWDWTVHIAGFGNSTSLTEVHAVDPSKWPSMNSHYLAPECYDGVFDRESDVFAFGLILFEIVAGAPAFPRDLRQNNFACTVVVKKTRPDIPDFVLPRVGALISDCWAHDPDERPLFEEIVEVLRDMDFEVVPNVNSAKMKKFVKSIEDWESGLQH
jgi:serine/threonine protein kinase